MSDSVVALSKCRICLIDFNENELHSLFSQNEYFVECLTNADLVMACSSVQISKEDGFPQNLCRQCYTKLSQLYEFRQLCEHSDKVLHDTVHILNVDVKCEITHEHLVDDVKHEPDECDPLTEFKCTNCSELFYDEMSYTSHVDTVCGRKIEIKQEFSDVEPESPEINFMCKICRKKLNSDRTFKIHILKYHPLSCHVCFETFQDHDQLLEHIVEVHKLYTSKYKRQICPVCEKVCYDLPKHHITVHNSHNQCSKCDKLFASYEQFLEHVQNNCALPNIKNKCSVQNHIRPYAGELCPKKFAQFASSKVHSAVHTGETNYPCEISGETFPCSDSVRVRLKNHSDEKQHTTIHNTDSESHKCEVRKKTFSSKRCLVVHGRTHTGERPYACGLCPRTFTHKLCLRIHRKSKHKERKNDLKQNSNFN